jgi:hypothetical protein
MKEFEPISKRTVLKVALIGSMLTAPFVIAAFNREEKRKQSTS